MPLFETVLPADWRWEPLGHRYHITKKLRKIDYVAHAAIPFVPMEAVAARGDPRLRYEFRTAADIASGTYFERGDVLLSRITPSFENGKQGLADDLPGEF